MILNRAVVYLYNSILLLDLLKVFEVGELIGGLLLENSVEIFDSISELVER